MKITCGVVDEEGILLDDGVDFGRGEVGSRIAGICFMKPKIVGKDESVRVGVGSDVDGGVYFVVDEHDIVDIGVVAALN